MSPTEPFPARGRAPGRPARSRDEVRDLRAAVLVRLSPQERLLIMLAYADGLSTREIAAVTGLSPGRICEMRSAIAQRCRLLVREQAPTA